VAAYSEYGRPSGLSSFHIPLTPPPRPDKPVFHRRHERRSRSKADRRRCEIAAIIFTRKGALNAPQLAFDVGFYFSCLIRNKSDFQKAKNRAVSLVATGFFEKQVGQ